MTHGHPVTLNRLPHFKCIHALFIECCTMISREIQTDDNNVNFGNKFTFILLQMHLIWIWDGEEHALKVPCCKIVVHGQRLTPPVHLGNPSNPVSRLKFRSILSGRVWIGWFSARKINQEILCRCSLSLIWADQTHLGNLKQRVQIKIISYIDLWWQYILFSYSKCTGMYMCMLLDAAECCGCCITSLFLLSVIFNPIFIFIGWQSSWHHRSLLGRLDGDKIRLSISKHTLSLCLSLQHKPTHTTL